MVSSLITNGYLLSPERIARAQRRPASTTCRSASTTSSPDDISLKSLRLLEPKLKWLAEHAVFGVNINSVVGAGVKNPEDALAVARRARELGFTSSIGILHDGQRPAPARSPTREMAVYEELKKFGSRATRGSTRSSRTTWPRPAQQVELPRGLALPVRGRGRARQLLLADARDARGPARELHARRTCAASTTRAKSCAPYCTVNCVQRVALFDNWRAPADGPTRAVPVRHRARRTRERPGARGRLSRLLGGPPRAGDGRQQRHRRGVRARAARARLPAGPGGAARRAPARAGGGAGRRGGRSMPRDLAVRGEAERVLDEVVARAASPSTCS